MGGQKTMTCDQKCMGLYFNINIILWHILDPMPSMLITKWSPPQFSDPYSSEMMKTSDGSKIAVNLVTLIPSVS